MQSRFKKQRALGVELPGLGKAGALERRPYRPGVHGMKRKKYSDFAIQLLEKQKLRYHYGLKEYQLRNYVKTAKKTKGDPWIDVLIIKLESRLDNFIFRGQYANSIRAARQLIRHGHILVNGKKTSVSGYVLKTGDVVKLTEKGYKNQSYLSSQERPRLSAVPAYIEVEGGEQKTLKMAAKPLALDIPFEFNARLVTDYYSKLK